VNAALRRLDWPRSPVAINFVVAILVVIAWYVFQIVLGAQETDPSVARANRSAVGAVVLLLFEIALLVLYLRRGQLAGLLRVIAAIVAVIGLLQSIVVPLVVREMYGTTFPTAGHMLQWYAYGSHLLYALLGEASSQVK
jgi:predicted membrane-bound spermidine synthase